MLFFSLYDPENLKRRLIGSASESLHSVFLPRVLPHLQQLWKCTRRWKTPLQSRQGSDPSRRGPLQSVDAASRAVSFRWTRETRGRRPTGRPLHAQDSDGPSLWWLTHPLCPYPTWNSPSENVAVLHPFMNQELIMKLRVSPQTLDVPASGDSPGRCDVQWTLSSVSDGFRRFWALVSSRKSRGLPGNFLGTLKSHFSFLSIRKVTAMEWMERVQSHIVTITIITIGTDLKGILHLENGHSWTLMDLHLRCTSCKEALRKSTRTMSVFRYNSLFIFLTLAWNCSRTTTLKGKGESFVNPYTYRSEFRFRLNNMFVLYICVLYGFIWSVRAILWVLLQSLFKRFVDWIIDSPTISLATRQR